MRKISKKILSDLEFPEVLERIKLLTLTTLGKSNVDSIGPYANRKAAIEELKRVDEVLQSFESENLLPKHYFENIDADLEMLEVEDSFLNPEGYNRLRNVSETCGEVLKFISKFSLQFPNLHYRIQNTEINPAVHQKIDAILNRYGEVDDKASSNLRSIRRALLKVRGTIGDSFTKALARYNSMGVLDDIKESVLENRRVLAVQAMYRKKVKGSVVGSSKTGSIVFISPEQTLKLERELQDLMYDEKQEIIKILQELNRELRPYSILLKSYQEILGYIDVLVAKAKYAASINAVLPLFPEDKKLKYINAYHPLLLEQNKSKSLETVPQSFELNDTQSIIVISGPNAGGKSITLKTMGLLQLMIQSGILIPVDERSSIHFFDDILTDIGDNQSIENQLSTYSYRLKNMRSFLKRCSDNTLFLIDEFGTGSDPELGGALAEIFLEEFYNKGAYGVITTHYSNLKVLANELPGVSNASMLFDEKSLSPLYKLYVGQAGSSFTFEVAQKNGIPYSLINRAKKRVETEKIRLDKTISKLQDQRRKLQATADQLKSQTDKAKLSAESLSDKEIKIQEKLADFQALYDENQKMLGYGRRSNELFNKYFQTNNKKELLASFNKWVQSEKTKHTKKTAGQKPKKKAEKVKEKKQIEEKKKTLKKVEEEILVKVTEVRKEKKKKENELQKIKANYNYKVGDRVRLIDSRSIGTIDKIEKNQVTLNYGLFTTLAKIPQIELVEAKK